MTLKSSPLGVNSPPKKPSFSLAELAASHDVARGKKTVKSPGVLPRGKENTPKGTELRDVPRLVKPEFLESPPEFLMTQGGSSSGINPSVKKPVLSLADLAASHDVGRGKTGKSAGQPLQGTEAARPENELQDEESPQSLHHIRSSNKPAFSLAALAQNHQLSGSPSQQQDSSALHGSMFRAAAADIPAPSIAQNKPSISLASLAQQHMKKDAPASSHKPSLSDLAGQHSVSPKPPTAPSLGLSLAALAMQHGQSKAPVQTPVDIKLNPSTLQDKKQTSYSTREDGHVKRPPGFLASQNLASSAQCLHPSFQLSPPVDPPGPPPGFRAKKTINLSELAAQHAVGHDIIAHETETEMVSSRAAQKPSSLALALATKVHHPKDITDKVMSGAARRSKLAYPRFAYAKQNSRPGIVHFWAPDQNSPKPFDFSCPSPDDIVIEKQKGAFCRAEHSELNACC